MSLIIYAEDDQLMAQIVRNTLNTAGHIVGLVEDGKTALQAIWLKKPALVILDCSMPEMSGIDVLREMRLNSSMTDIPVLMLTGRQSSMDVSLAAYAGADGYIKKPFDPEYLIYTVECLLKDGRKGGQMARTG